MRSEIAIRALIIWYVLSTLIFIVYAIRPVLASARAKVTLPGAKEMLGIYISWVAWTLGYSVLMLLFLLVGVKLNSPETLLMSLVAYMGAGHMIGLRLRVPTRTQRLLMIGAPPLQAAITVAARRAKAESDPDPDSGVR
jgi:hypothetical protein